MKQFLKALHKLSISLLFLTLISCEGFFQMLTTTPNCIDAVDFGDIVSQKVTVKVNPADWDSNNVYEDPTVRCSDPAQGYDGYVVEYYDTEVDYTSTNNPLTIKAYGYGDFCSASYDTGYEKNNSDDCSDVDCDAEMNSSCCTMAIQEDNSSCQQSLITVDASIHGEQPIYGPDELVCSATGGASSSFYFNNTDNFLVLVPKLCIPGSGLQCDTDPYDYKDKKTGGAWEDCSACTTSNLAGCETCGCVLREFVCDVSATNGAVIGDNGLCDCGDVVGCSEEYIEVIKYTPDQIDFADGNFNYSTANTFNAGDNKDASGYIIADNVGDGVCSNFEYLVVQTYSDLKKLNDSYADWNYSNEKLQQWSLDSIQLGFITDMADNLTEDSSPAHSYLETYDPDVKNFCILQSYISHNA